MQMFDLWLSHTLNYVIEYYTNKANVMFNSHAKEQQEYFMDNSDNSIHPMTQKLKRCVDIIGASLALLITLPLFPFIAVAIKVSSPGTVFFYQSRIGLATKNYTRIFEMIKFRTMIMDAEKTSGAIWASAEDPRITKVGMFLRKSRLDELPQLINVIKGDMSLIGPRPERPGFYPSLENEIPFFAERTFGIMPGITGLAQVNQGYDTNVEDVRNKLCYDLSYALALSSPLSWIKMDTKIAIRTILVMVTGRGR